MLRAVLQRDGRAQLHGLNLRARFIAAGIILVMCLGGQAALAFQTASASRNAVATMDRTQSDLQLATEALRGLVDMETGYRGFLLTGRIEYLEPYESGRTLYLTDVEALRRAAADNPEQVQRWDDIERAAEQWRQMVTGPGIDLRWRVVQGTADMSAVIDQQANGKADFDHIRSLFAAAMSAEQDVLRSSANAADEANARLQAILIWGSIAGLLLAVLVALRLARGIDAGLAELVRATEALASGDLSSRIRSRRTDEIGRVSAAFDQMTDALERDALRRDTMLHLFRAFAHEDNPNRVFDEVLVATRQLVESDGMAVFRFDPNQRRLVPVEGTLSQLANVSSLECGRGLIAKAIETGRIVVENQYQGSAVAVPSMLAAGVGAGIAVPLAVEGRVLGALAVWRLQPSADFTPEEAATLEGLCTVGAATLARVDRLQRLRAEAGTDVLTRLPNRRQGMDLIQRLIKLSDRQGEPLSLAVLDLDHFKDVNDRFGHMNGDAVLRKLGRILADNFRSEDVAVRWGGEEFVLAMFGATSEDAVRRLRQLLQTVRGGVMIEKEPDVRVTFSAGVAEYRRDANDLEQLLEAADVALYAAKAAGRARIKTVEIEQPTEQKRAA